MRYLTGSLGTQTRTKLIELHHLTVSLACRSVLDAITLDIFAGESVALVGTNADEKETLLACLLGQIQPAHGEIRVLGASLPPLPRTIHRQLGIMPQQLDDKLHETVAACLQRFAAYHEVHLTDRQIAHYCAHYHLQPAVPVKLLTNFQVRILTLALALVHDPRLAFLVEPLTDLSEEEQTIMQTYLRRIQREGRTLLCTFTPPLAERYLIGYDVLVKLEQGRLLRQEH